jgi:predicted dinucleotide-binding enzyme
MKYAIIGSGNIGSAIARAFAKENLEVVIANSRGPETLASLTQELGPSVSARSVQDAAEAEMILLAVPFSAHRDVAKLSKDWRGKIIVDATNVLGVAPAELESPLSSEIMGRAFVGARLVKAFNHLPAEQLGTNPPVEGQRQVVFVSSDDAEASASVAALVTRLGFAPVELGKLAQGGAALHVLEGEPGGLLFQNLAKLD